MRLTAKAWSDYADRLSRLNTKAGQLMRAYLERYGAEDTPALIAYASALVDKYGEGSAELACQMYDAMAEAAGLTLPAAEPAAPAAYGEVAKAVNGTKHSPALLQSAVSRLVKQAGADTTLQNAIRDGAEFAWIPHGDTCAFCLMLASRGWQKAGKRTLKNGHAEHIHANCDCEYAVRFSTSTTVAGYDPEQYLAAYESAEGRTYQEKLNSLRRAHYAENRKKITAQKRAAYAELHRRRVGEQGQEIIDKPTYVKLTREFLRHGGVIIRGEDAERHLRMQGAYASYMPGGNFAFIRDDATVSDVLEEMYHAMQERKNMFSTYPSEEILVRREIDAQKYLIAVAKKYKIPAEETEVTRKNLANYEAMLEYAIWRKESGRNEQ